MLRVQSAVVEQSLVLKHPIVGWDIIILDPSSKRVKQQHGVLVTHFQQLLSCVFQEENVAVMQWVSDLESVNSICIPLLGLLSDLLWIEPVLIQTVIEKHFLDELGLSREEPVSFSHDSLNFGVVNRLDSESSCADFFFSVLEEFRV